MCHHIIVERMEMDSPTESLGLDTSKYRHIVIVQPEDSFSFPNVDSCLAVIIELENRTRVAAHLGLFDPGYGDGSPTASINGQLDEIKTHIGGGMPFRVIIIGDSNSWDISKLSQELIAINEDIVIETDFFVEGLPAIDIHVDVNGKMNLKDKRSPQRSSPAEEEEPTESIKNLR